MMRMMAVGLAAVLAPGLLGLGPSTAAAAGKNKGKGGSVAMESVIIAHEGFRRKSPDGKYVIRKIPGRPDAAENKSSRPLRATGGKQGGGEVPRYHLQDAWPSK